MSGVEVFHRFFITKTKKPKSEGLGGKAGWATRLASHGSVRFLGFVLFFLSKTTAKPEIMTLDWEVGFQPWQG